MERDEDLLISLINFLIAHGYPKDSFALEWSIGGGYRVDLAVIDPDTNKAIALFELKREKTQGSFNMALRQFENFSKVLGDEKVPIYVVFGKEGEPPFEIYYLQEEVSAKEKSQPIKISKVPDFTIFKSSKISQEISKKEENRKTTMNWFQIVCWIIAFLVLVLLILDFFNILVITPERLAIIGVIAGLIIIPFASKLKILGVEFERLKERKERVIK